MDTTVRDLARRPTPAERQALGPPDVADEIGSRLERDRGVDGEGEQAGRAASQAAMVVNIVGILVGAAFVGLLPNVSSSVPVIGSTHGQDVVFGAAVILVMLLLPGGASALIARLRGAARA